MRFGGAGGERGGRGTGIAGLATDLAELLWPTRCVGCDLPGPVICTDCARDLPWVDQRWACPVCGAPFGLLTCTECGRDDPWETRACICAMDFEDTAARMVLGLKDRHDLALAPVVSAAILAGLAQARDLPARDGRARFDPSAIDVVTFVPATAEAYRRRGFDHMELVARALAAQSGIPLADVLVRQSARDQRELGRTDRAGNLAGTVRAIDDVRGLEVLLADDVVTTGSTLRESARALLSAGAKSVTACALARVW